MSHISDLFKKVENLQGEIDNLKKENKTLKEVIKDKTGVDVDNEKKDSSTDDAEKKDDTTPTPAPVANKPNCPVKLDVRQGSIVTKIMDQLRRKGLSITQLLNWVEESLQKNPKVVLEIRRAKKN